MGSTVIGGMLAATCLAIFIIPVTFYVVEKLSHKGKADVDDAATTESAVKGGDDHA
jgi:HAE1 family hydrophobic/amphiphilic exporter-1